MAKLQAKLETDLKTALKAKQAERLSTLRLLKSDLQYEMSKSGAKELKDDEVENVLKRAAKKRREAIKQYEKAGRKELLEKEKAELTILEEYLPPAVSDTEIKAVIEKIYAQFKSPEAKPEAKDLGKLMGAVMGQLKGRTVDGARVRLLLLEKLK